MGKVRAGFAFLVAAAPVASAQQLMFTEASVETGIVATQVMAPEMLQPGNIAGGAVGDFNNDGWQDLLVLSGGVDPDRLYINNGDGTFTDRAGEWGVAATHYGVSATCADYNGDGWLDISVSSMGPSDGLPSPGGNMLYRNNGDGTFTDVAEQAGVAYRVQSPESFATAFGDYDGDGDLDMFSTCYATHRQGNRLWRNGLRETGEAVFTDVTVETGLEAMIDTGVSGFVPAFCDMDLDGHLDLILAADHGTSMQFRGLGGGAFEDITPSVARLSTANGMGIAIADFNRDGLLDWYESSIQWSFLPSSGNLLYLQRPDGGYDEAGRASGVNQCGWSWGVLATDLDHDGWEEIVATKRVQSSPSHVFKQDGSMSFSDISLSCGFLYYGGGRGLVNFDYDNDGDQDVVVFTNNGEVGVWRNDLSGPDTNWLRIDLDTSARAGLAPMGFHSLVRIKAGDWTHMQPIDGATNHCSSGELGAHFGLGSAQTLDVVRVEWADGTSTTLVDVPANQRLMVEAPASPADLNNSGLADLTDVVIFVTAFLSGSPVADLDGNGLNETADVMTYVDWFER